MTGFSATGPVRPVAELFSFLTGFDRKIQKIIYYYYKMSNNSARRNSNEWAVCGRVCQKRDMNVMGTIVEKPAGTKSDSARVHIRMDGKSGIESWAKSALRLLSDAEHEHLMSMSNSRLSCPLPISIIEVETANTVGAVEPAVVMEPADIVHLDQDELEVEVAMVANDAVVVAERKRAAVSIGSCSSRDVIRGNLNDAVVATERQIITCR